MAIRRGRPLCLPFWRFGHRCARAGVAPQAHTGLRSKSGMPVQRQILCVGADRCVRLHRKIKRIQSIEQRKCLSYFRWPLVGAGLCACTIEECEESAIQAEYEQHMAKPPKMVLGPPETNLPPVDFAGNHAIGTEDFHVEDGRCVSELPGCWIAVESRLRVPI
jgi:hypothetical protein